MALARGTVVETAFEASTIEGPLGSGGAGTVYSATDSDGHRQAIKVLNRLGAPRSVLKRFKNEIHFCSKDVHQNIIRITDQGLTDANEPFYVMRCYSGSLRKLMRQSIKPAKVLPFFGQMLDGVEAAHFIGCLAQRLKAEHKFCFTG